MNSIYLTCRMKLRDKASLSGKVIKILEANQIIEVHSITEESDGYVWFNVGQGYVANVDEVFYHSDAYQGKTSELKKFIIKVLDDSVNNTNEIIKEMKKALERF